jgi:2-C-methyl-D-erythritol 2,4-cyclodiphosphate synthase
MRVGFGYDAHRFSPEGEVRLGGVIADDSRGVAATSDGDVVVHALIDALLGACALGDVGTLFPSSDPASVGGDGLEMLARTRSVLAAAGFAPASVDVTVVSQSVRVAPIRDEMRTGIASALGLDPGRVAVKATTTDGLGATGRDEGLAAYAVAVVAED